MRRPELKDLPDVLFLSALFYSVTERWNFEEEALLNICIISHKYSISLDDPCCYPLGFMYISARLKQLGHTVKVLNFNLWDYDLAEELKGQDATLFTGFEEFMPTIVRDAALCRGMGVRTILGGALATFKPQEMLLHVDTVVIGEGEAVLEAAFCSFGIVQGTKPYLDTLPLPDYDGFGIEEYHRRHPVRYMGVLTSRGCPYACKFCAHTCSYQCRELSAVFEEVDHYKVKYGVSMIVFNDNTLNANKDRFLAICQGMKGRGLSWSAAIRVDNFDEEMASAFKQSGGVYFVVGVESFNQAKLDAMNKRVKSEQIIRTLDLLHKYQIAYHGYILVGFPGETFEGILQELATMPQGYNVFPSLVLPYVGTSYSGHTLEPEQAERLDTAFRAFAIGKGMSCRSVD